jgi:hypothetical protein
MRKWLGGGTGIALGAVGVASCLDPTQITVEVRTDFPCEPSMETRISVGGELDASPGRTGCERADRVGTLVVTPSGAGDRVDLRVVAMTSFGPIEARRRLSYLPHAKLSLPITLTRVCAGQRCAEGTTCVSQAGTAVCVPSDVDPRTCAPPRVCDDGTLDAGMPLPPTPIDGGKDAGADGGTDAGPFVAKCPIAPVAKGASLLERWSFDAKSLAGDAKGPWGVGSAPSCGVFPPGAGTSCGLFLDRSACTADESFAADFPVTASFEVALRFFQATPGVVARHVSPQLTGWEISCGQASSLSISLDGTTLTYQLTGTWTPGAWHELHLVCTATPQSCSLWMDGVTVNTAMRAPGMNPSGGSIEIGAGTRLDEVDYFTVP